MSGLGHAQITRSAGRRRVLLMSGHCRGPVAQEEDSVIRPNGTSCEADPYRNAANRRPAQGTYGRGRRLDPYGSRSPLPGEQKRSPVRVSKRICPLGAWRVRGQEIWPWSRRLADPGKRRRCSVTTATSGIQLRPGGQRGWPPAAVGQSGLPARCAPSRHATGRPAARHHRQQPGHRREVGNQPAGAGTRPPYRDDVLILARTGHVSGWSSSAARACGSLAVASPTPGGLFRMRCLHRTPSTRIRPYPC